jgi:hypothetical protein
MGSVRADPRLQRQLGSSPITSTVNRDSSRFCRLVAIRVDWYGEADERPVVPRSDRPGAQDEKSHE